MVRVTWLCPSAPNAEFELRGCVQLCNLRGSLSDHAGLRELPDGRRWPILAGGRSASFAVALNRHVPLLLLARLCIRSMNPFRSLERRCPWSPCSCRQQELSAALTETSDACVPFPVLTCPHCPRSGRWCRRRDGTHTALRC